MSTDATKAALLSQLRDEGLRDEAVQRVSTCVAAYCAAIVRTERARAATDLQRELNRLAAERGRDNETKVGVDALRRMFGERVA